VYFVRQEVFMTKLSVSLYVFIHALQTLQISC
jgi:hypothetical protein